MVTQSLLNQYRREVESASNDAKNYVKAITEAYRIAYPEASVADIRNYTLDAINNAVNVFGGQSMLVANDFFEQIAKNEGVDVETDFYSTFDFDTASSKVHYLAKEIVNGDIETFNGKVQDLTAFYVKREAFCNLAKNYMKNGLRYARVPSGRETCAFCFMLCSRGFVYWTEEEAGGAGHKYHSHCDCIIVPGFHKDTGIDEDAQIEGYHPSKLRERYKQCLTTVQTPEGFWDVDLYNRQLKAKETTDDWEKWKTKQLVKEINKRDTQWLWTGRIPKVGYPDENYVSKKIKENKRHELRTAQRIASNGFKIAFAYDEKIDKTSSRHKTIGYADFTNGYEIKTPMEARSAHSAVKNAYEKTVGKIGVKRLIIDNYEAKYLTDKNMIKEIREQNETFSQFTWVSMINKDGTLIDVIKKN